MRTVPQESFQFRAIGPQNNEHTSPPFSGKATVDLAFDLFNLGQKGGLRLFVQPTQTDSGPPQKATGRASTFHEAYNSVHLSGFGGRLEPVRRMFLHVFNLTLLFWTGLGWRERWSDMDGSGLRPPVQPERRLRERGER